MDLGLHDERPLHAEVDNPGGGSRLVLVHGFTQNRLCWGQVAPGLAEDHEVVRLDAPGHGRSGHAAADLRDGADLIGATGGRATYIGYSMGGRFSLQLALDRPDLVDALAVLGASPGIEDPSTRAERAKDDDRLAERLESMGLEAFLDEWLDLPLFSGLPVDRAHRSERLDNDPAALAASLRHAGTGRHDPLWARLERLAMPVLVLVGEHDSRYRDLATRMVRTIGANAELATVTGAGHAAHLENPSSFLTLVRRWLGGVSR